MANVALHLETSVSECQPLSFATFFILFWRLCVNMFSSWPDYISDMLKMFYEFKKSKWFYEFKKWRVSSQICWLEKNRGLRDEGISCFQRLAPLASSWFPRATGLFMSDKAGTVPSLVWQGYQNKAYIWLRPGGEIQDVLSKQSLYLFMPYEQRWPRAAPFVWSHFLMEFALDIGP